MIISEFRHHHRGSNQLILARRGGDDYHSLDLRDPEGAITVRVDRSVKNTYLRRLDGFQAEGLRPIQVELDKMIHPQLGRVKAWRTAGIFTGLASAATLAGSLWAGCSWGAAAGLGGLLLSAFIGFECSQSALGPAGKVNNLGWTLSEWRGQLADGQNEGRDERMFDNYLVDFLPNGDRRSLCSS